GSVRDDIEAKLAVAAFHLKIRFADRRLNAVHDQFEVIDERLHLVVDLLFWRKGNVWTVDDDRSRRQTAIDGLLQDAQRLPHFFEAHEESRIRVAAFGDRHIPIVRFVAEVGRRFTNVERNAAGAQTWSGE